MEKTYAEHISTSSYREEKVLHCGILAKVYILHRNSHLVCTIKYFYMECYTGLKWIKRECSLPQILNLGQPKCFQGSLVNRTQNSKEHFKPFWRVIFGRGSVIHPLSYGVGLMDKHGTRHKVSYLIRYGKTRQSSKTDISEFETEPKSF